MFLAVWDMFAQEHRGDDSTAEETEDHSNADDACEA
jgi:hypothetical protein